MTDIVTARAITGLWQALTKPEPGPAESVALDIYRDAAATGWASTVRVESMLLATDPGHLASEPSRFASCWRRSVSRFSGPIRARARATRAATASSRFRPSTWPTS